MSVSLTDIEAAAERLRPYLPPTPLEPAPNFDSVWLKLENANKTHSFKVRGALNTMLSLTPEERARGIVAVSTGNHAQGTAYAAHLLGLRAQVIMPEYAVRRKVAGVRRWGAEAVLFGETYDAAEIEARRIEREEGKTFISPYNDPRVVAGGGTVGLEIMVVLPRVDRVIVPVGGGGLISGIGCAVKSRFPQAEVIGVNPAESPDMYNIFYDLDLPLGHDTLADALPGEIERGSITRDLVRQYVDRIVLVSEHDIARAMRWLVYDAGWVGEGGGVAGIAALMNGAIEPAPNRTTVVVITGGNVDADTLRAVLAG